MCVGVCVCVCAYTDGESSLPHSAVSATWLWHGLIPLSRRFAGQQTAFLKAGPEERGTLIITKSQGKTLSIF